MTRADFAQIMAVLRTAHHRAEITDKTMDAYYVVLRDLDPNALEAAALQLLATSKWFPKPSELRAAVFDLRELASDVPDAYTAWEDVLLQIRKVGYSGVPEFKHELTAATVERVGGWRNICMSTSVVADRMRFVDAYKSLLKRERTQTRMLPQVRELARLMSDGGRGLLTDDSTG